MKTPLSSRTARGHRPTRILLSSLFLAAGALAGSASAQTPIGGVVYDGNGGPLLSGTVYHTSTSLTIPVGETLTIQAGAIVKGTSAHRFIVNGTLDVNGTSGSQVRLTSIFDDSAGGDTNADGPSVGTAGDWGGIEINASGTLTMDYADVAYAGGGGWAPVYYENGVVTIANCTLRDSSTSGIDMNGFANVPSITGCDIRDNAVYAVTDAKVDHVAGFSNCTASGNGLGDFIRVIVPSPTTNLTIDQTNVLNDTLVFTTNCTVPTGITMNVEAGIVIKWETGRQIVNGTLNLNGTEAEPTIFTSFEDDDFGGDTNKDGASNGLPGDWSGIEINASGTLFADETVVRYAGGGGWAPIYIEDGTVTVTNSVLRDALGSGIDMNGFDAVPTIQNCDIRDNGGYAVDDMRLDTLEGYLDNTASGNALGDFMRIVNPTPAVDVTATRRNALNDVLVYTTNSTVGTGITLEIEEGLIVKWQAGRQIVNGTLLLRGTEDDRVQMTSFEDDTAGGDTNKDGASSGLPGDWSGIEINASGTLVARHSTIRYAGGGGWAPVYGENGSITVTDCEIRDALGAGMDFNGFAAVPTIENCVIRNNGGHAIQDLDIDTVPGFLDNVAMGNTLGDAMRVISPSPTGDVRICRANLLGDVLVFTATSTVATGIKLTLEDGIVLKWTGVARMVVNGSLDLLGSGAYPIVFTAIEDDLYGGDTNKDGSTTVPAAGEWQGIDFNTGATASRLENVLVRFSGASGIDGVTCDSAGVTLRSVRVEHSSADGFEISAVANDPVNLVAFNCGRAGIRLDGGSFDLIHATAVGNGINGIESVFTHSGDVINSIAWGNVPANFSGFGAGRTMFCNGDPVVAGSDGNINIDPLFIDTSVTVGDLTLGATSPCIDVADGVTAATVVKDHVENSRLLDPTLSGTLLADMGAYEYAEWEMVLVDGEPRLGNRLKFRVDGPAGTSLYMLGFLDGNSLVSPFGFITAGTTSVSTIGTVPVGTNKIVLMPRDPLLIGVEFGVQTKTFPVSPSGVGAITNLFRTKVERAKEGRAGKLGAGPEIQGPVTYGQ